MKTLFILICIVLGIQEILVAQSELSMEEKEQALIASRQAYLDTAFSYDAYSNQLAEAFRDSLLATIQRPESVGYPFNALQKVVGITVSEDRLLRTFSFNFRLGGSNHETVSYAQYVIGDRVEVLELSKQEESPTGLFTDVGFYKCYNLTTSKARYYLLIGWGTHGGGHHHKLAYLMKHTSKGLEVVRESFNGEDFLVIEAPRTYKIFLQYDPFAQSITFPVFSFNEENGFYEPTNSTGKLIWEEKGFVKD